MVDDSRDSKWIENNLRRLPVSHSLLVCVRCVVMDFDFDFIESTINSSAEEMSSSLSACLEEIKSNVREAELIDGAQDLTSQLNAQIAAVSAI